MRPTKRTDSVTGRFSAVITLTVGIAGCCARAATNAERAMMTKVAAGIRNTDMLTANADDVAHPARDQLLLAPAQRNTDIAWFSLRPVGDLILDAISFWLQKFLPKLKQLLGQPCKRLLPTRLLLVDGAPMVGKKRIRKAADFHFGEPIVHGPVDDRGGAF